jgi:hypothetical protein
MVHSTCVEDPPHAPIAALLVELDEELVLTNLHLLA